MIGGVIDGNIDGKYTGGVVRLYRKKLILEDENEFPYSIFVLPPTNVTSAVVTAVSANTIIIATVIAGTRVEMYKVTNPQTTFEVELSGNITGTSNYILNLRSVTFNILKF